MLENHRARRERLLAPGFGRGVRRRRRGRRSNDWRPSQCHYVLMNPPGVRTILADLGRGNLLHSLLQQRAVTPYPLIVFAQHGEDRQQAVTTGLIAVTAVAPDDFEQLIHGSLEVVLR